MRVLVTGAYGFIGSHICEGLLKLGHEVRGCDDLSGGEWANVCHLQQKYGDQFQWFHPTDCGNRVSISGILYNYPCDTLVHCAANAREGASQFQPASVTYRNFYAAMATISAALERKVKRLIIFSSMAIYGNATPPFDEMLPKAPVDIYGLNKAAMEEATYILSTVHDFQYCILRPHNCFDKETEILTKEEGWKYFSEVDFSDEVATLNPKTNTLEWQTPTAIQQIPHKGPMYSFQGRGHDLVVTGDHHLWIRTTKHRDYGFMRADELQDTHYMAELATSADWEGKDIPYKVLPAVKDKLGRPDPRSPERKIDMDTWIQLAAWIITEGSIFSTPRNYVVNITKYDPKTRKEIMDVITKAGYSPYDCPPNYNDIRILSLQLYNEFVGMAGAHNKYIPTELKNLPKPRLRLLLDTLIKGDGDRKNGKFYKTVSFRLAGDVQEIAIKLGYRATISLEENRLGDKWFPCYRVSLASQDTPQLGDNREKKIFREIIEDCDDTVYDVTVPNHVILVRRNGKAVWSGNCMGPRQALYDIHRNVVGIFMNIIMRNEPLFIYGDGEQTRAFSYIEDSLPAFLRAILCDDAYFKDKLHGRAINAGGKIPISVNQLALTVKEAMDVPLDYPTDSIPDRPREVKHAWCTTKLSEELLGYKEEIGWEEGIRRMAKWAKEKGPQEWRNTEELEVINELTPIPWIKAGR